MKIAILGSAPSSMAKAPFGDPGWAIWACSPGTYAGLARVDEFFELHRWEPGVIGKADTQKPWFSPEYVAWMRKQQCVWVADPAALNDLPNGKQLPWQELVTRYGHYCWTSTVSYMLAMAIDRILARRAELDQHAADSGVHDQKAPEPEVIGLWGVDMAANEELYSGQRWAAQWFLQLLVGLKIDFYIPPESDLATPPPMYGVSEVTHRAIKLMERRRELAQRLNAAEAAARSMSDQVHFLRGALDDLAYHQSMWQHEGDSLAFDFSKFPGLGRYGGAGVAPTPQGLAEVVQLPERKAEVHGDGGQDRQVKGDAS